MIAEIGYASLIKAENLLQKPERSELLAVFRYYHKNRENFSLDTGGGERNRISSQDIDG